MDAHGWCRSNSRNDRFPCAGRDEARVLHVEQRAKGVQVEAEVKGKQQTLRARAVIFAIPGQLVPRLCPGTPEELRELLSRTQYSRIVNAAVALAKPPSVPYAGYAFTPDVVRRGNRDGAPARSNRCPEGTGMASIFLWNTQEFRRLTPTMNPSSTSKRNCRAASPNAAASWLFVHLVRWNIGIAQFPPGRLREMTALRKRLAAWNSPFDLCGDYLDGLSSEGALRTGEEAADRIVTN